MTRLFYRIIYLFVIFCSQGFVFAQDSLFQKPIERETIMQGGYKNLISVDFRAAKVIPTAPFYKGMDNDYSLSEKGVSAHLQYAFGLPEGSFGNCIFPQTSQGIGLAYFNYGNAQELGNPMAGYIFQNAEILRLNQILGLHYEWNFGLSTGWKYFDTHDNPKNVIIGSKENAYINAGLFLRWYLAKRLALNTGFDFTHFSNGNTEYPNSGFNTSSFRLGLQYDLSKKLPEADKWRMEKKIPSFERHWSYDVVAFGSWRRKGVYFLGNQIASPHRYPVLGAYIAPMYNFGYRVRAGASLDLIHDGSANVYTKDYIKGTEQKFFKPYWKEQIAAGLSARADYIMPIFTLSVGLGTHFLNREGDFKGTYQSFALKTGVSKSSFLHIGYSIKDFHEPNYLMLGLGYRFNNRRNSLLSIVK